ncbi:hypothetical protein HDV05_006528 [Chytridiales sp. JEL 0842]|nr:hypothetical protein HDV05_006528 [Chytridiales sp. JEL 0842]
MTFRHLAPRVTSHPLPGVKPFLAHPKPPPQTSSYAAARNDHATDQDDELSEAETLMNQFNVHTAPPSVPEPLGPSTLPPLSRLIYARFIRSLPIFAGRGQDFMKPFDAFVETTFVPLLGLAKHYLALFYFAGHRSRLLEVPPHLFEGKEHYNRMPQDQHSDSDSDIFVDANENSDDGVNGIPHPPSFTSVAKDTQAEWEMFQSMIMDQLTAQSPTHGGRFKFSDCKNQQSSRLSHGSSISAEGMMEPKYPHLQTHRYHSFKEAWMMFLETTSKIVLNLHSSYKKTAAGKADVESEKFNLVEAVFEDCRRCKNLKDMPEVYQVWVKHLIRAVSVTIENILDDRDWRRKITAIWSKLPISLIVGSLRIINPIPFVERLLRLFLWRPPGGLPSLLMKLCQILAGSDRTNQRLKSAKKSIPQALADRLDRILEHVPILVDAARFNTPYTDFFAADTKEPEPWAYSSNDPPEIFVELFQSHAVDFSQYKTVNGLPVSDTIVTHYCRAFIRKREKDSFVDLVGSDQMTQFIVHVCHFLPPFLTEMWECVDMHMLASAFFKCCGVVLDLLKDYQEKDEQEVSMPGQDPHAKEARERRAYDELIQNIDAAIYVVFEKGYPMIHELSKRPSVGPSGMHAFINWLADEFGNGLWESHKVPQPPLGDVSSLSQKRCVLDMRTDSIDKLIDDVIKSGPELQSALLREVGSICSEYKSTGILSTNHYQPVETAEEELARWLVTQYGGHLLAHEHINAYGGINESKRVYLGATWKEANKATVRPKRSAPGAGVSKSLGASPVRSTIPHVTNITTGSFEAMSLTSQQPESGVRGTSLDAHSPASNAFGRAMGAESSTERQNYNGKLSDGGVKLSQGRSNTVSSGSNVIRSVWKSFGSWGSDTNLHKNP